MTNVTRIKLLEKRKGTSMNCIFSVIFVFVSIFLFSEKNSYIEKFCAWNGVQLAHVLYRALNYVDTVVPNDR